MYILVEASDCANPALLGTLTAMKAILKIIQIAGPILLILSLVVGFTKGVFNPEDKKFQKKIINSLIAIVLLFFTPIFIDAVMSALGQNFTISSCWNAIDSSDNNNGEPEYTDPYDQEKTKIIEDKNYDSSGESSSDNNTTDNSSNNNVDTSPRT